MENASQCINMPQHSVMHECVALRVAHFSLKALQFSSPGKPVFYSGCQAFRPLLSIHAHAPPPPCLPLYLSSLNNHPLFLYLWPILFLSLFFKFPLSLPSIFSERDWTSSRMISVQLSSNRLRVWLRAAAVFLFPPLTTVYLLKHTDTFWLEYKFLALDLLIIPFTVFFLPSFPRSSPPSSPLLPPSILLHLFDLMPCDWDAIVSRHQTHCVQPSMQNTHREMFVECVYPPSFTQADLFQ